jgi:aminocarboxymuconate-semialdehyde decarboxylase
MLRHLIDRFGADHVLLGTDYPFDMGVEDPVGFIAKVPGISSNEKKLIEGMNAAKLLKIDYNKLTSRRRS